MPTKHVSPAIAEFAAVERFRALAAHVLAMADDTYLTGHPEWHEIVSEARAALERT